MIYKTFKRYLIFVFVCFFIEISDESESIVVTAEESTIQHPPPSLSSMDECTLPRSGGGSSDITTNQSGSQSLFESEDDEVAMCDHLCNMERFREFLQELDLYQVVLINPRLFFNSKFTFYLEF